LSGPAPRLAGDSVPDGSIDPSLWTGKALLINVWASWCAPCRREQPGLEALWRKLAPGEDVQFLGVNHRDGRAAATRWIERYGVTYPSIYDPNGEIAGSLGVPFVPATILVDRHGQLRYRLVGEQRADFVQGLLEVVVELGEAPEPGR
jgi:thiol-disulfide isomerase/thioredoxin